MKSTKRFISILVAVMLIAVLALSVNADTSYLVNVSSTVNELGTTIYNVGAKAVVPDNTAGITKYPGKDYGEYFTYGWCANEAGPSTLNADGSYTVKAAEIYKDAYVQQLQIYENLNKMSAVINAAKTMQNAKIAVDIMGNYTTSDPAKNFCWLRLNFGTFGMTGGSDIVNVPGETTTVLFDLDAFTKVPNALIIQFNNYAKDGGAKFMNPEFTVSLPYIYVGSVSDATTVVTATTTEPITTITETTTTEQIIYGDANDDGAVNSKDSLAVRKFIAEYEITINEKAADVNLDTVINSKDSLLIRKYIAEVIPSLPVQ